MLTRDELAELYRNLKDEKVLSVYLDGMGKDPAQRRVWRRRLDHEMEREAHRVSQEYSEDEADFETARDHILGELDAYEAFLPGKGWVSFATPEGIRYAESLPAQVPTIVRWEKGPRVASYVRGLKQLRPMVTALLDRQRARVFLYKEGSAEEVADLRADTFLGDLMETAVPPRASNFSGTRGETVSDAAQRYLAVGTTRMMKRVKDLATELTDTEGFFLMGGSPEALAALKPMIPRSMEWRVLEQPSLHLEMSLPEVEEATAEGASALSKRRQEALLTQVVEQAHANGKGCLGGEETMKALEERRVDTLLLSRAFVEANPDYADQAVTLAFEQDADVRVLGGAPSEKLDAQGGGIGARLRYRIRTAVD